MSKLPMVSSRETIKALAKIGYSVHHQKGAIYILKGIRPVQQSTYPATETHPEKLCVETP